MTISFKDFKSKFAKDRNQSIATGVIELPSNRSKATLKPMVNKDLRDVLKAMEKRDEYLMNEAFDKILEKCVVDIDGKPLDNDSLCIQDRMALLLAIRKLTTGPQAKISHVCPESQKVVTDIEVDLDKCVETKYFEGSTLEKEIELNESIKVVVGPLTRKQEKEIDKWTKKSQSRDSMIDKRYAAYASIIKSIKAKNDEGIWDDVSMEQFDDKVSFVTDICSMNQTKAFDDFIKGLDFGIKVKIHFKSDVYENDQEEVPLISFFIM